MKTVAKTETWRFASQQADIGLNRLAFQIKHALEVHDAEAVHDLRVAIRRFSQTLRVFKPCLRGKQIRKIRRELKQMMDLAGEVRNLDIAIRLLLKPQRNAAAPLRSELCNLRRQSNRALAAFLKKWLERKSSLKWRQALASSFSLNAEKLNKSSIERTAQRMLPPMAKEFFERGNEAVHTVASPRELHQFRIICKKFRYTLELFAPTFGPALNARMEVIKRAQGLLGDINDYDTVRRILSSYKGDERLVLWLKKRQRRRVEDFHRFWSQMLASRAEMQGWRAFLASAGSVHGSKKPTTRSQRASPPSDGQPAAA